MHRWRPMWDPSQWRGVETLQCVLQPNWKTLPILVHASLTASHNTHTFLPLQVGAETECLFLPPQMDLFHQILMIWRIRWMVTGGGKLKYLFVHHKCDMCCLETENVIPRWKAGDRESGLWHAHFRLDGIYEIYDVIFSLTPEHAQCVQSVVRTKCHTRCCIYMYSAVWQEH
jgi:hypothetical protein